MLILGLIDLPIWLLLLTAAIVAFLWHTTRSFNYFKKQGINGVTPYPLIGSLRLWGETLTNFPWATMDIKKKYGTTSSFFFGSMPILNVFDEDILSDVFVKDFDNFPNRPNFSPGDRLIDAMMSNARGKHWKHLRTIISPTFSTGKLKRMMTEMNRCAAQMADYAVAMDGQEVELKESAGCYTLDTIAITGFGVKLNSQQDKNNPFVKNAKAAFTFNPLMVLLFLIPGLIRLLRFLNLDTIIGKGVFLFFRDVIKQAKEARKEKADQSSADFLQLMINAQRGVDIRDTGEDAPSHDVPGQDLNKDDDDKHLKKGLTDDELLANGIMFFLAGYETTATALSFLMYNLALNPDCQDKVIEEIDSVMGDKEELSYDMQAKMSYLDQCVHESLRLFPPAASTVREANRDLTIKGIHLKKGMSVAIPIIQIHYDEEKWPEPKKFIPDRFSPENKAKHGPFDWLPFGYGPRNCVAMRLALVEVKVGVVRTLRKVKFTTCSKTEVPMKFKPSSLLQPKNGIWLKVEKRLRD